MKILVMCLGNINRSAFAAAFLDKNPKLEVRSAGFLEGGRRASPTMREYARRWGITLEEHRSQQVTREMVDWAQIILFMGPSHITRLNAMFPNIKAKQENLAEYVDLKSIPDPAFNKKRFEEIADLLVSALNYVERQVLK